MAALQASLDGFDNLSKFRLTVHKAISILQTQYSIGTCIGTLIKICGVHYKLA